MTDDRHRDAERELERDLEAYRRASDRDLPSLEQTTRILRSHAAASNRHSIEEGIRMKIRRSITARPALAIAGAVAVVDTETRDLDPDEAAGRVERFRRKYANVPVQTGKAAKKDKGRK